MARAVICGFLAFFQAWVTDWDNPLDSLFGELRGRGPFAFARGFELRGERFFRLRLAVVERLGRGIVESVRGAGTAFSRSVVGRHKYDGTFLVPRRGGKNKADERFETFDGFSISSSIFSCKPLLV